MAGSWAKTRRSHRLLFAVAVALSALAVTGLVVHAATRQQAKTSARNVKNSFQVRGSIDRTLIPGRKLPVKIEMANNKSYPLWITRLRLSAVIDHEHRLAGCSISRDFRFTQLGRKAYPFRLAKRKFRVVRVKTKGKIRRKRQAVFTTLRAGITRGQPTIEMLNLSDVNQDACKGAKISFVFDGRAERNRRQAFKRAGK